MTARRAGCEPDPTWSRLVVELAVVGCLGALAGTTGCDVQQASAPSETASPTASVVRRGTLEDRFLLTGELEATDSDRIVVPRTPVWQVSIRWIEADGVEVAAGQPVLELDNSQFTGELEQDRLAEAEAVNNLRRKQAELAGTLSEKAYQVERRRIELEIARLGAAVPAELLAERDWQEKQLAQRRAEFELHKAEEELRSAHEAGDAELEDLRLSLERARSEIRTAERAIEQLTLTAPRAGVLVVEESGEASRKLQVGDTVWVGMTVATIPNLSRMQVAAWLSDVDDGRIATGMRARCTLDAYPDTAHDGTIVEITPVAREENEQSLRRFYRVVIELDTSDPARMRPGMSVKAEVRLPPRENVLLVPRQALSWGDDGARLALADGSLAPVRVGPCSAFECVIDEGASEGTPLGVAG